MTKTNLLFLEEPVDLNDTDKLKIGKQCLELISNSIFCHICKIVPRGSVYQKIPLETGSVACGKCPSDLPNKEKYQKNIVLENTLASLEVTNCKNRKYGCHEVHAIDTISIHEQSCQLEDQFNIENCVFDHDIKPKLPTTQETKPDTEMLSNCLMGIADHSTKREFDETENVSADQNEGPQAIEEDIKGKSSKGQESEPIDVLSNSKYGTGKAQVRLQNRNLLSKIC